ncbi:MAG: hypothetical protein CMC01_01170 [Flavobacteriaceae bacterium]|nr:hypothetical protein [Flavobacteriaceae bacterium]|tara:strand:+ start:130 stop:327 length:198 start_codon:yes stop_codon:yes gene_type:complete
MPLEIKELIVKGIVESDNKTSKVDIVKLIDEKLSEKQPQNKIDRKSIIEECVREVLTEIRKQLDY